MCVYRGLKRLEIGGYNFKNVRELRLIGLSELESVEIGRYSFTKYKNVYRLTHDWMHWKWLKWVIWMTRVTTSMVLHWS